MSAPQEFATVAEAAQAFAAGHCRRWVRVAGHQIDLVQHQAEQGRVREDDAELSSWLPVRYAPAIGAIDRESWDRCVDNAIAAELARAVSVDLPPLATSQEAAPECCPRCGRPLIGGVP